MCTKRCQTLARWTCFVFQIVASMTTIRAEQTQSGPTRLLHQSNVHRQQVESMPPQHQSIIDVNHHYSDYNYPDSADRFALPSPLYSHSNELVSPTNVHQSPASRTNGHMSNLTASVGRNATFECVFPDLKKDFRDLVVVKNGRVSVRSHANTTFYLTIHDIREEDRGSYMCQVNTVPMRSQIGHLEVNVPPTFVEQYTSSDVNVREKQSVSLRCSAKGRPKPELSWRREDGRSIDLNPHDTLPTDNGEYLNISTALRTNSGAYLCIASNGIPSPISKRIFLGVIFAPVITTSKQSIGVTVGSTVILACNLESYPQPSVYWRKDDQMPPIIHSDHKHEISLVETNTSYRFILKLKIVDIHKSDLGKYTCVAKNMLAEVKTSIRLHQIEQKTEQRTLKSAGINTKFKNAFLDRGTTRNPLKVEAEHKQVTRVQKVADNFSFNQESAKTEVFGYETDFISPEMSNEQPGKENKASPRLVVGCPLLLSSSVILLQRVFALQP